MLFAAILALLCAVEISSGGVTDIVEEEPLEMASVEPVLELEPPELEEEPPVLIREPIFVPDGPFPPMIPRTTFKPRTTMPKPPKEEKPSTYAVYVPKYIRPGIPYAIDVEIMSGYDGDVDVVATLMSESNFKSVSSATVMSGSSENIKFESIPYGYSGSNQFKVVVVGFDKASDVLFNVTSNRLSYQKKFLSIFIQTDKAIYQPGQTIKFRAVITTPDLRPFDGETEYKLEDPRGNVIMRQRNAQLDRGVVGSQFKLSRYSTQGEWRISYEVHGYRESITVSVEEYTLPKFSVEIKADQAFLHPGSPALTGEVKAMYTFGQPVKGSGYVEFSINTWSWRFRNGPPKIRIQFPEFDGTEQFEIKAIELANRLNWNPKYYSQPITIFASVTEKNTGETFNTTSSVNLESVKMKVEALAKPDHIKPGLPYTAYLKISQQDGSDLPVDELQAMRVEIEIEYRYDYNWRLPRQKPATTKIEKVVVGDDGLIAFTVKALEGDWDSAYFKVMIPTYPDKNQYWNTWTAQRFDSPSSTYLQVTTDDSTITAGDTATVTVATTQVPDSDTYRISIVARGKVALNDLYTPPAYHLVDTYQSFEYSFLAKAEYAPSIYIVISFVRADGEFVADTVKINVEAKLENEVTMTTSTDKTDAGMPVSITVSADPGSYVGLRAIDQSVLLLKSGNDITRDKIFSDLDRYGVGGGFDGGFRPWGRWWWPWSVGGGDVSEVFENSGFMILTDGLVYKTPPTVDYYYYYDDGDEELAFRGGPPIMAMAVDMMEEDSAVDMDASDGIGQAAATPARSYFPESWIWSDSVVRDDGSVTFNYNTPDTITTWELSSFAVSNAKGLGVTASNTKITVFRSFFISLSLPSSIVRGEILNMKTTLFNYFDTDIDATLTLNENEWYDLVIPPGASVDIAGSTRLVRIPSKDSVTIVFPIKFKKVGNAKISLRALTPIAGDAVERVLLVKPEGVPKVISHSRIIDRPSVSDPPSVFTFDVDIPADAVEGSTFARCAVSGNILGNSLSNIGSLLRMPSGCGEQTMINFAPSVFVSKYLKEANELTGEFKQKSENFIREGYQNELRYQRGDGSFSAFGSSDASGSTWLTAFVVKCFIAANDLNPDLVEETKIQHAVRFLLKQQNKDGTFNEPGRVIHKDMQGGVESDETTAAYMLIALTEGNMYGLNSKDENVRQAIEKTQEYLEGRIDFVEDIYTLAIAGYALSLIQSDKAGAVMARMDLKATIESNVKFWKKEETGAAKCDKTERYCPFDYDKPSTSSVEITAYVLLTYVKLGRINEVMPIVRWIVQQKGAFGGYHSTQDTVMAIQALATVAGYFSDRTLDMTVTIAHDAQPSATATFKLTQENAIILQMAELPAQDGTLTVSASGVGIGDAQCTIGYNLPVGPRADEPFVVDVDSDELPDHRVKLTICSRINEDRTEVLNGTGMYVVTFTLPSGYTIDQKQATNDNPTAKLVELVGEEVTGYFDELARGKVLCLDLMLIRYAEVAGVKPKMVVAYDYYSPEIQAMRELALKSDEDVCRMCGNKCAGCDNIPDAAGCGDATFPCPDFTDGLFYDSGSAVMELMISKNVETTCEAPRGALDSSGIGGPPGSLFNGINQYISCENPAFLQSMLTGKSGFTISIAVRPQELAFGKTYVIYTIGSTNGTVPYVIMSKRRRSRQYWFRVRRDGWLYTVRSIPTNELPLNQWSIVTARQRGKGATVFVNGKSVGTSVKWRISKTMIANDSSMRIGRSHYGNANNRGNFKGLVSGLDMWSDALTDGQILVHYLHYQRFLQEVNPVLSTKQARRFVTESLHQCFDASTYLASQLKSRAGKLDHSCQ